MLDIEQIGTDCLRVLKQHGLTPDIFGIHMVLSPVDFDRLMQNDPRVYQSDTLITTIAINSIQTTVQIRRRYEVPPHLVMHPPAET